MEEEDVGQQLMGVLMELPEARQTSQSGCEDVPVATCAQGRLINDVLTNRGERTGQGCCLECGGIVDDPTAD